MQMLDETDRLGFLVADRALVVNSVPNHVLKAILLPCKHLLGTGTFLHATPYLCGDSSAEQSDILNALTDPTKMFRLDVTDSMVRAGICYHR